MEIMDSFFGKNGTMQGALNVASDIKAMQSGNAMDRLSGLSKLVQMVMSLFA